MEQIRCKINEYPTRGKIHTRIEQRGGELFDEATFEGDVNKSPVLDSVSEQLFVSVDSPEACEVAIAYDENNDVVRVAVFEDGIQRAEKQINGKDLSVIQI